MRGHNAWVNDAVIFQAENVEVSSATKTIKKMPSIHALTAAGDQVAVYWNAKDGSRLLVLEGHLDEVTGIAVIGRGRFAVTSALDGTAKIWDLAASSQPTQQRHPG